MEELNKYVWCFQKVPTQPVPFLAKIKANAGYCWALQPDKSEMVVKAHKGACTGPYKTQKEANKAKRKFDL